MLEIVEGRQLNGRGTPTMYGADKDSETKYLGSKN